MYTETEISELMKKVLKKSDFKEIYIKNEKNGVEGFFVEVISKID